MSQEFDSGYVAEPFVSLCRDYPHDNVYPAAEFRLEWGPIFHRGRLDGSARVLVIGQDPAQHETVTRRILIGEAGHRTQGFLAKLGITRSYVMINTFLYSVYGSVKSKTKKDPRLVDYRNRWIDALVGTSQIEAVVTLGQLADQAWQMWKATPNGRASNLLSAVMTHPTQPESASEGNATRLKAETKKLLKNWNNALQLLTLTIQTPDVVTPLALYGETWSDNDRLHVPSIDLPPGLPEWMMEEDGWAKRVGKTPLLKRRNITINVPSGVDL